MSDLIAESQVSRVLAYERATHLARWTQLEAIEGSPCRGRRTLLYTRASVAAVVELRAEQIRNAFATDVAERRIAAMRERLAAAPNAVRREIGVSNRRPGGPVTERRAVVPDGLPSRCPHTSAPEPAKQDPRSCSRCWEASGALVPVRRDLPRPALKLGQSVLDMQGGYCEGDS